MATKSTIDVSGVQVKGRETLMTGTDTVELDVQRTRGT